MKKIAIVTVILCLVGLALPRAEETKGKTHDVAAQVVAVDVDARTLTIKGEKSENKTLPVGDSALEDLKKIKAGDRVILTCQDNEKGEHVAIVAIRPAKS